MAALTRSLGLLLVDEVKALGLHLTVNEGTDGTSTVRERISVNVGDGARQCAYRNSFALAWDAGLPSEKKGDEIVSW